MTTNEPNPAGIITSLRLIFWGALIHLIDIRINGFDLLNDFIAMILITCGVFGLAGIRVDEGYQKTMLFVRIVAVLLCLEALHAHFDYQHQAWLTFVLQVLGLCSLIACVAFCFAMRQLCTANSLDRSADSWRTTGWLFVAFLLIPFSLLQLAAIPVLSSGGSLPSIQTSTMAVSGLEILIILLLVAMLVPLVHFFCQQSANADGRADDAIQRPPGLTPPQEQLFGLAS